MVVSRWKGQRMQGASGESKGDVEGAKAKELAFPLRESLDDWRDAEECIRTSCVHRVPVSS